MKKITLLANLLLVFSLSTLTFSCNKDDEIKEDDAVQEFLFKISFSNDWLCSECGEATLFISDENGLLLAEKSWIGNASLEFPLPNGVNKDQSISISIIHSRPSEQLYVYSYDQVPIGSEWKFKGSFSNPQIAAQQMNLHFANIPEHNSWILSTLYRGRKYNGDSMSPTEEITYTSEPVDVFIRLDLDEQNKEYGFFENVTDTTVLDMSHLELSNSKMVQFPSGLYSTYYTLYAYPEVAAFNSNSYMVELISEVEQEEQVFFPSQLFSGNRTRFSWKEEEDSYQSKTIVNYGAFPDEYSVFIGDLEVMQKEIDEFEINYSGDFDIAMSSWRAPIDDNYLFWFYYAPTDLSSFQLPELPDSFRQVYPSYHNDSLELSMVKLKKYSNFSSYDDYLDGRSKSELIDESTEIHELNNYLYLHKESAVKVNLKLLETLEDPFSQDIY